MCIYRYICVCGSLNDITVNALFTALKECSLRS